MNQPTGIKRFILPAETRALLAATAQKFGLPMNEIAGLSVFYFCKAAQHGNVDAAQLITEHRATYYGRLRGHAAKTVKARFGGTHGKTIPGH